MNHSIYIIKDGINWGPYSEFELNGHIQKGSFQPEDIYWHSGLTEWRPISQYMKRSVECINHTNKQGMGYRPKPIINKNGKTRSGGNLWSLIPLVLAILAVISFTYHSQKPKNIDLLNTRNGLVYFKSEKTPFTGKAISKYSDGKIREELSYKDGKESGTHSLWNENGLLIYQSEYLEGEYSGTIKTWANNGDLLSETRYYKGLKTSQNIPLETDSEVPVSNDNQATAYALITKND